MHAEKASWRARTDGAELSASLACSTPPHVPGSIYMLSTGHMLCELMVSSSRPLGVDFSQPSAHPRLQIPSSRVDRRKLHSHGSFNRYKSI